MEPRATLLANIHKIIIKDTSQIKGDEREPSYADWFTRMGIGRVRKDPVTISV